MRDVTLQGLIKAVHHDLNSNFCSFCTSLYFINLYITNSTVRWCAIRRSRIRKHVKSFTNYSLFICITMNWCDNTFYITYITDPYGIFSPAHAPPLHTPLPSPTANTVSSTIAQQKPTHCLDTTYESEKNNWPTQRVFATTSRYLQLYWY